MLNKKQIALMGLALCLAGCGGVAESLGLGRNAPDEFAVVDRPPLSLPPDYDLRPPRPGAPRPQEISMPGRASETLFGGSAKSDFVSASDGTKSDSESALLEAAGAAKAEANIRDIVDRETSQKIVGSKYLVEELLWWRDPSSNATTVDPAAEAARIREAKEKGESINTGATPVIEKSSGSWLGQ